MAKKAKPEITFLDPSINDEMLEKQEKGEEISLFTETPLIKSILNTLDGHRKGKIHQISFTEDPQQPNRYSGIYYDKLTLLPDKVIKTICIRDDLVAAIITLRSGQASPFGRPLNTRFGNGFRIEPNKISGFDLLPPEEKKDIQERISKATQKLFTCGTPRGWDDEKHLILPTFLGISASNAIKFGRFTTEIVYTDDPRTGGREFHSFRPTDPATVYKTVPQASGLDKIREQALHRLQELTNDKLKPERYINNEYSWVQVINGVPCQAYTSKEMLVHNCYPSTDIELNGYPITPIDTAIAAITTHINITNHNKLYFEQGRAAKGMLVFNSDTINPGTLADMRQQFNANINSVRNSWRTPIIKVGKDDGVEWKSIESVSKDMEFQYLSDSNARVVLSAFQVGPEEIPGYTHLSKGTNNQALSESSNEWKLEAARDAGIRPLLSHLQDFLNSKILPLIDEKVAKYCSVKFYGLDAETEEKEAQRLTEAMPLHGTYDEILAQVEKPVIGRQWGGQFPLNPQYQAVLDRYFTVGEIKEYWFGIKGAAKDPKWAYARDQFWMQNQQMVMEQQAVAEQKQLAEQQIQQQGQAQEQQGQQPPPSDGGGKGQPQDKPEDKLEGEDIASSVDQAIHTFAKSEKQISLNGRKLLAHHTAVVKNIMSEWHKESEVALAEISELVAKNKKS